MLGENGHPKDPQLKFSRVTISLCHFYFYKYAWRKTATKKTHNSDLCRFCFRAETTKTCGQFFLFIYLLGREKRPPKKPTTQISVAFALRAKSTEKPFNGLRS